MVKKLNECNEFKLIVINLTDSSEVKHCSEI